MNDPLEGFRRGNHSHSHFQSAWGCGKARNSRLKSKAWKPNQQCLSHENPISHGRAEAAFPRAGNTASGLSVWRPNPRGGSVHWASWLGLDCLIKTIWAWRTKCLSLLHLSWSPGISSGVASAPGSSSVYFLWLFSHSWWMQEAVSPCLVGWKK